MLIKNRWPEVFLFSLWAYVIVVILTAFSSAPEIYVYEASLIRVIDGDTFEAEIEFKPFRISHVATYRLNGIDVCEIRDLPCGPQAKDFAEKWLSQGSFSLRVHDRKTFDRWVADVFRGTDSLREKLQENEFSK